MRTSCRSHKFGLNPKYPGAKQAEKLQVLWEEFRKTFPSLWTDDSGIRDYDSAKQSQTGVQVGK
jgi:hypothetical protein